MKTNVLLRCLIPLSSLLAGVPSDHTRAAEDNVTSTRDVRIVPGTHWVIQTSVSPEGKRSCLLWRDIEEGVTVIYTINNDENLSIVISDKILERRIAESIGWKKEGQSYHARLRLEDTWHDGEAFVTANHTLMLPLVSAELLTNNDINALFHINKLGLVVGNDDAIRGYDVSGLDIASHELLDCYKQNRGKQEQKQSSQRTDNASVKGTQGPASSSDSLPSDSWQRTSEDEAILTLPNGQRFVSQIAEGQVKLIFPTGQTFASESAKGDLTPPLLVSKDGTLVVVERHPATQSGDIHIYIKETNGSFKEAPNVNEQIDKLLKGVKGAWGGGVLWMKALSDHTLTLWSVALHQGRITGKYQFEIKVAPDGSLSLATPPPRSQIERQGQTVRDQAHADAKDQGLTKFTNQKYGCSILVPLSVFPNPPQQPDDEHIEFLSTDGKAKLELVIDQNPRKRALAEVYREWIAECGKKGDIGYKTLKGNWFVVSGDASGNGYYTKCVSRDNKLFIMNVEYPEETDDIWETTLTTMSHSFNGH